MAKKLFLLALSNVLLFSSLSAQGDLLSDIKYGLEAEGYEGAAIAAEAGSSFSPFKVHDVPGNLLQRANIAATKQMVSIQRSAFYKTIADAAQLYKSTTDIAQTGYQLYNTGVSAFEFARRVAGDVKGMTDLQSYQLMFARQQAQEVNRITSYNTPLIDFNRAYNSSIRKYISAEGALDPLAMTKAYLENPTLGYSKILIEMTNANSNYLTMACRSYEAEAVSYENMAHLYEMEGQYINRFIMYANMGSSMDKLMSASGTIDEIMGFGKDGQEIEKTVGATGGTVKLNAGSLSNSLFGFSNSVNSVTQGLIKKEMDNYSKNNGGKEITAQNTEELMVRLRDLNQQASVLRQEAGKRRAKIYTHCGQRDFFNEVLRSGFTNSLANEKTVFH